MKLSSMGPELWIGRDSDECCFSVALSRFSTFHSMKISADGVCPPLGISALSGEETPAWPMPPPRRIPGGADSAAAEGGDAADLSDLEHALAVQACATPGQIAHTRMTARLDPFEIFSEVLGPGFTATKYPSTKALLGKVRDTWGVVKDELKTYGPQTPGGRA